MKRNLLESSSLREEERGAASSRDTETRNLNGTRALLHLRFRPVSVCCLTPHEAKVIPPNFIMQRGREWLSPVPISKTLGKSSEWCSLG